MSEVIAVASGKGGTGKSTVCAGIGTALAASGFSVILLELDFGFRCLDVFFGLDGKVRYDICDYSCGRCLLKECINKITSVPGLSLICAPSDIYAEPDEQKLGEALLRLKELYDFVIIDVGAGKHNDLTEIMKQADRIFLVTTPDDISIRAVSHLSEKLYRAGCTDQRLIINRIHKKYIENEIVENLDYVIDKSGLQLIGAVPESMDLTLFYGSGKHLSESSSVYAVFSAIAGRICGENKPLTIK